MSADITQYTDLVTSEHQKPNFLAAVAALVQPFADLSLSQSEFPVDFDLDAAVGAQLDIVGQWVGVTRYVQTPLTGVYFSFDDASLGFDQGTWLGPYDPTTGQTVLADDAFRNLIRAAIVANSWDGSLQQAVDVWNLIFGAVGYQILVQDNNDMTMIYGLMGSIPDAVTYALFTQGYFDMRPAGVDITSRVAPSVGGTAFFGFDLNNSLVAGFDTGSWTTSL